MELRILRRPEVVNQTGLPAQTLQDRINAGLFPKGISLGGRAVGWPEHEVQRIIVALIRGSDLDTLRSLARQIEGERGQLSL